MFFENDLDRAASNEVYISLCKIMVSIQSGITVSPEASYHFVMPALLLLQWAIRSMPIENSKCFVRIAKAVQSFTKWPSPISETSYMILNDPFIDSKIPGGAMWTDCVLTFLT